MHGKKPEDEPPLNSTTGRRYRDPNDISDSDEEVHPNISAKSFHHFIRQQRLLRLEELREKASLTEEELKEKEVLEYKTLPALVEVVEDGSFHAAECPQGEDPDYRDHLAFLLENGDVDDLVHLLDTTTIDTEKLGELIYYNLSSAIKENNDDIGYALCRIGLLVQWATTYGRKYLLALKTFPALDEIFVKHYEESKEAIFRLHNSQ